MEGFTSIPVQNLGANEPNGKNTTPYTDNQVGANDGIEINDTSKPKPTKDRFGFLFPLSFLFLFLVFGYFGYLYFLRWTTLQQITDLSNNFEVLAKNFNKNELEEFLALENSLKLLEQKLPGHVQVSYILNVVNRHLRTSVIVTDYKVDTREKEVVVSINSVASSLKELAEQAEKMSELKFTGLLKNLSFGQLSLEADGRRIRYVLNLTFDKSKVSVTSSIEPNTPPPAPSTPN